MQEPTIEELKAQIARKAELDEERKKSDDSYAIKLIEKIVFGIIVAIGLGLIGGVVDLFFTAFKSK